MSSVTSERTAVNSSTTTNPPTSTLLIPPRKRGRPRFQLLSQVLVVAGFLVAWGVFAISPMGVRADMPGPLATVTTLFEMMGTAAFWQATGSTVVSWAMALAIAIVVGVPTGLLLGRNRWLFDSSTWTIDFLRTIPPIAIVPLVLLVMGRSQLMVVMVSSIPALWPILVQSVYAGQQADPLLHRVARSLRLTTWDRIRWVLAPDALAFIWPGIRLATTAALMVTIFAELLGGGAGIGTSLMEAQIFARNEQLYAWVLTSCALGLIINAGLALLQRRLLWWHPSMREKH